MPNFSVVIATAPPMAGMDAGGAFVKIDGRESLLRSVELFLNRDVVKQIHVIVAPAGLEEAKKKYGGHFGFSGVKLLPGGPGWADQLSTAAEKISEECSHVVLHDAARPAVSYADIESIFAEAEKHPIVALAAVLRSSLAQVDDAGKPTAIFPPQKFLQMVTPWVFKREKFLELAKSKREPAAGEIHLLKGSTLNVRVGSSADAQLVKTMINMLPKPKIRAADNPFEEAQW
jgi:2-C-methyl-D-erythritol 4-phosphate cytidylyltransferase